MNIPNTAITFLVECNADIGETFALNDGAGSFKIRANTSGTLGIASMAGTTVNVSDARCVIAFADDAASGNTLVDTVAATIEVNGLGGSLIETVRTQRGGKWRRPFLELRPRKSRRGPAVAQRHRAERRQAASMQ